MCSGSEAGSYLRLLDFVYHSTLGLRVIKKKKKTKMNMSEIVCGSDGADRFLRDGQFLLLLMYHSQA